MILDIFQDLGIFQGVVWEGRLLECAMRTGPLLGVIPVLSHASPAPPTKGFLMQAEQICHFTEIFLLFDCPESKLWHVKLSSPTRD